MAHQHNFIPNMNGNNGEELGREFHEVHQAALDLIAKINSLQAFHGRNYQTMPESRMKEVHNKAVQRAMMNRIKDVSDWAWAGMEQSLHPKPEGRSAG